MKVTPYFGHEGTAARVSTTPGADWLDQLCGWVRRPPGDIGPLGWPVLLMAERINSAFTRPGDARTVYQRVRWSVPVRRQPLDLEARTASVTAATEGNEVTVVTTASSDGARLAESYVVIRTAEELPPWGRSETPPVPSVAGGQRRLSFALSEHDVADFAALSGVHEPIHEDATHAWALGHPNVLVQELMLLLILLQQTTAGEAGTVEMWFPAAIPVGSSPTLWQQGAAWEVRATGTGRAVVVGLVT